MSKSLLPEKTVERLSRYRRILLTHVYNEKEFIYSHELAHFLHLTSVQVRRDLMLMGYTGNPSKGYHVTSLITAINDIIDPSHTQYAAVIGMGNLGNAIAKYLKNKRELIRIVATFDVKEELLGKCLPGINCYHFDDLQKIIKDLNITIGIITVPPQTANEVKEKLIESGILGILNFTATSMLVPDNIFLEEYDIITSLEKIAYFTKHL